MTIRNVPYPAGLKALAIIVMAQGLRCARHLIHHRAGKVSRVTYALVISACVFLRYHRLRTLVSRRLLPLSTLNDPQGEHSPEDNETFGDLLSAFERTRVRPSNGDRHLAGTVVAISADSVFVDIRLQDGGRSSSVHLRQRQGSNQGRRQAVRIKQGTESRGLLRALKTPDRTAEKLECAPQQAFAAKAVITGTVTAAVKGGLTVDIGVRAFMPASRSGAEGTEMEKVGRTGDPCRIHKADSVD